MRRLAAYQAAQNKQAWAYYFSHVPPGQEARGATHMAELAYMFNQQGLNPNWQQSDRDLGQQMAQYWVNFARTGIPNGQGLPVWPLHSSKQAGVMSFAEGSSAQSRPVPSKAELNFFERY